MLILSYTTIYFYVKKFIFPNVYISVNAMFECFCMFFWLRRRGPSIKCVRCRCGEGDHPKCVQGGERCHTSCVPISFHVFGSFFCLIAFCFICKNLSLPLFKKDVLSKTVILLQRDQFLSS